MLPFCRQKWDLKNKNKFTLLNYCALHCTALNISRWWCDGISAKKTLESQMSVSLSVTKNPHPLRIKLICHNTPEFRFLFFVKIVQYYSINIYNDDLTFVPELELRVFSIPVWFGKQSVVFSCPLHIGGVLVKIWCSAVKWCMCDLQI